MKKTLILLLLPWMACSHGSLEQLHEDERDQLSAFDLCAKKDTTELLSTDGTSGEIADFVMNNCDSQYQRYKEALLKYEMKRVPNPQDAVDYENRAEKLAQDMWDKIRLKVVKFVEKKKPESKL